MKLTRNLLKEFVLAELNGDTTTTQQTNTEEDKPSPEEIANKRQQLEQEIINKKAELDAAKSASLKLPNLETQYNELISLRSRLGR